MIGVVSIVLACALQQAAPPPSADLVLPRVTSAADALRIGVPLTLRLDQDAARGDDTVVLRARGAQRLLEPNAIAAKAGSKDQPSRGEAPSASQRSWTIMPDTAATYVVLVRAEGSEPDGSQWRQRDKLILPIAPAQATEKSPQPSPSASARFGEEIELTPLTDPTHTPLGSQTPIQLKANYENRADLPLMVYTFPNRVEPATSQRAEPDTTRLNLPADWRAIAGLLSEFPAMLPLGRDGPSVQVMKTNASGVINLRVDRAGWWIVTAAFDQPETLRLPNNPSGTPRTGMAKTQLRATLTFLRP